MAHQQTLLNPPITPSYTYYYGQSVIPANPFQYGTMYPVSKVTYKLFNYFFF